MRRRRNEQGLSQMALAAEAGLHLTALGSLERGRRNPSLHTVFVLAQALGCRPQDLVAETYNQQPDLKKDAGAGAAHAPGRPPR